MNTYQCKDDIINADEKGQLLSEVKNISLWSNKLSYYAPKDDTGTGIRVMKVREDDDYHQTKVYKEFIKNQKSPLEGLFEKLVNKINPKLKFFVVDYIRFAPMDDITIHKDSSYLEKIHKDSSHIEKKTILNISKNSAVSENVKTY